MTARTIAREREHVLEIRNLKVAFHTYLGEVKAIDGIDLSVNKGEIIGLVGESGCGKSVTALSIIGLLPHNAEVITGEILLDGIDLRKISKNELRQARLRDLAMVFQDPMTYLNPVLSVGSQITEVIMEKPELHLGDLVQSRLEQIAAMEKPGVLSAELRREKERLVEGKEHKLSKREVKRLAKYRALSVLKTVRLPEPERVFDMFPFELSGGMRQRAMIAMALIRKPKLILADEITTALDVTVQAQILALLKELKNKIDASILLITHDLAVVAKVCDRVAVMYAGNIVEIADVKRLFQDPLHPYTQGLLASIPRPDTAKPVLSSIPGSVPDLVYPPTGCRFHPRCPKAFDDCAKVKPTLVETTQGHYVACLLYGQ